MLPLIATTCTFETIVDSRKSLAPRYFLAASYASSLVAAGAQALIVPHVASLTDGEAQAILAPMAGLMLTGGDFDVPPQRYDEAPHDKCGKIDPVRTDVEATLLRVALAKRMPVLGICGGMQLINVEHGGALVQDVSLWPNALTHEQPFDRARASHPVRVAPGSLLARVLATSMTYGEQVDVNSMHHQLLGRIGKGLRASAWAPDGVVEAVEPSDAHGDDDTTPFLLGVQWHPEAMADDRQRGIFRGFAAAASAYQKARAAEAV